MSDVKVTRAKPPYNLGLPWFSNEKSENGIRKKQDKQKHLGNLN